jgi:hypothetical protein
MFPAEKYANALKFDATQSILIDRAKQFEIESDLAFHMSCTKENVSRLIKLYYIKK